jgi:hypothetical protein
MVMKDLVDDLAARRSRTVRMFAAGSFAEIAIHATHAGIGAQEESAPARLRAPSASR